MQFGFIERINDTKLKKRLNLKFVYSEKATKFCDIFTLLLSYIVLVKSKVKIKQNFVAFSEYMNFTIYIEARPITWMFSPRPNMALILMMSPLYCSCTS